MFNKNKGDQFINNLSKRIELQEVKDNPLWLGKLILKISENERRRLASDLHDEVLQEITTMKNSISHLTSNPQTTKDEMSQLLIKLEAGYIDIIELVRETCNEMMPSFLVEKGIIHCIEILIVKKQQRSNIHINFECIHVSEELDSEETLTIYRVVQELINNAVKHSRATELDIKLKQENGHFSIYYRDDGIGMNLEEVLISKHLGFHGMKERIKALKGIVTCHSKVGAGLEVSCQFPLKHYHPGSVHDD